MWRFGSFLAAIQAVVYRGECEVMVFQGSEGTASLFGLFSSSCFEE